MICRSRPASDFGRRWGAALALSIGLALSAAPHTGAAQSLSMPDIPVLTIEADRLFAATQFGQRLAADLEVRGTRLAAENRRIESELAEEESKLTSLRPSTDPQDFREMADAFDVRVQQVRAQQDDKARTLAALSEQAQRGFLTSIAPILEQMMNERGASVVLDRRAVFLSADASDITAEAIARIDTELSEGRALDELIAPALNDPPALQPAPQE